MAARFWRILEGGSLLNMPRAARILDLLSIMNKIYFTIVKISNF